MNKTEIVNFIKEIELFKHFDEDELIKLSEIIKVKDIEKDTILFNENDNRKNIYIIYEGEIELFKMTGFGKRNKVTHFAQGDFLGEGAIMENSPHSTSAQTVSQCKIFFIPNIEFKEILDKNGVIAVKFFSQVSQIISRRMSHANIRMMNIAAQYVSGRVREEHDLLGYRNIPDEFYYGIQTLRARENFNISGVPLSFYPSIILSFAMVKKAAAKANFDLGILDKTIADAIIQACDLIINGRYHRHFVVDMIQGGAGTSTNMNANEVIANVALEIMGKKKGEYKYCHPNNHVNLSQSTNDAYPTAVKLALVMTSEKLIKALTKLVNTFRNKAIEFKDILKMGRTQLQDAVPMTLGQEFEAYAATLEEEVERTRGNAKLMLTTNMGATAIGTGINSVPGYSKLVTAYLKEVTGMDVELAKNLVEATQDTGSFVMFSSAVKRLAIKLSKISNDLRLLSSGPRCGFNEINLPAVQPGSSIMPGKVNPVIPEVVNQIAFKVIGNDLTVALGAEAGQLELNVMEPIIIQSLFESIEMLINGMNTLENRCISGITANGEHTYNMVINSIGIVTALNPIIGYETSTKIAKEAIDSGRSVYDLVLEQNILPKDKLDEILLPENMIAPHKFKK